MNTGTNKKLKRGLLFFTACWIIFAQSCMKFRISDSKAKAEFDKLGLSISFHYTTVDDITLHYTKSGSDTNPTLFFVHGSPGSWDAFKMYMKDTILLQHFRIISIDRPGFGYSDFGRARNLAEQAKMINAIIEKEDNKKPVHLIGHSIGAPVIVQMAQDQPNTFASLTLLSGYISPAHEPKEYWRYLFMHTPLSLLMPGAFRPSNNEIIYFKKELYRIDSGYEKLKLPVTFIHGEADNWVPVKNVDYGKNKLVNNPAVQVHIIPGAGHFIPWENYDIIQSHLLSLVIQD
ncbi:MAG: alpha/beta hydrolase [Ferruginibacter sp.]